MRNYWELQQQFHCQKLSFGKGMGYNWIHIKHATVHNGIMAPALLLISFFY